MNQTGQVLIEKNIGNGQITLDINMLPAGVYFVNVVGEHGSEVYKFVKL
jgi:hypothetical protein